MEDHQNELHNPIQDQQQPHLLPLNEDIVPPQINQVQTLWTEDYVAREEQQNIVRNEGDRNHNQTLVNILNRNNTRKRRIQQELADNGEEQIQQLLQQPLVNRGFTHYCPTCWQRFCRNTTHRPDTCMKGRDLRTFMLNHNQ